MSKSNRLTSKDKSSKAKNDFPLWKHPSGRWTKKIRGKLHYFGRCEPAPSQAWTTTQYDMARETALNKYLDEKDDLLAGRKPRKNAGGLTIGELCDQFLNTKRHLVDTQELTQRYWDDLKAATDQLVARFSAGRLVDDLRPDDFEQLRNKLAKSYGPTTLGNLIQRVRMVFKYALDNGLIARPVVYGQGFKRPSQKKLREVRNQKEIQMFEAEELRKILAAAADESKPKRVCSRQLKAMILLGINCGFGNNDCGLLPLSALDLKTGWVTFPRPKTAVKRRCPLWPETVAALQEVIDNRPSPKDEANADLVFVTKYGQSWSKRGWYQRTNGDDTEERAVIDNPISKEMRKLLDSLGINGHRNFYCLRHTFETVASETDRQTAVDFIMGHAPRSNDMSAVYRERISDERLESVTDYVRKWLGLSDQE